MTLVFERYKAYHGRRRRPMVGMWFCVKGSRRLLPSPENHIKIYARARACVGLVRA